MGFFLSLMPQDYILEIRGWSSFFFLLGRIETINLYPIRIIYIRTDGKRGVGEGERERVSRTREYIHAGACTFTYAMTMMIMIRQIYIYLFVLWLINARNVPDYYRKHNKFFLMLKLIVHVTSRSFPSDLIINTRGSSPSKILI